MVSRVGAAAAASNAECEELEKVCGVNYDPRSIIFCPELRPLINMPDLQTRLAAHALLERCRRDRNRSNNGCDAGERRVKSAQHHVGYVGEVLR